MTNDIKISEISGKINKFVETLNYQQNVKLYLLRTRAAPTEIYQIQANDDVKSTVMEIIQSQYDSRRFQDKPIAEYDPVIEKNDTHKIISASQYPTIQEIVKALIDKNELNQTTAGKSETEFSDYMVEFEMEGERYTAIGSFGTVLKTQKFKWFGNLTDNKLKKLDKNGMVGLNSKIDSLIIGDATILIHGVQGFERVFELKALFSKEAKKTLNTTDFQKYISQDVLTRLESQTNNGGRLARRLTKLRNNQTRLDDFFKNINKVSEIVGNKDHPNFKKFADVIYDTKNKILSVPNGKEEQMLNVLSDANYSAQVSGHIGYDESR
ncbi:MAG: DUF4868 domain-containing protein [Lactobacillaceae bacterium]|jgi:hypothetical protein|nr:DUF4868 domain-containing protein [Lactobacillaceae bacterium]